MPTAPTITFNDILEFTSGNSLVSILDGVFDGSGLVLNATATQIDLAFVSGPLITITGTNFTFNLPPEAGAPDASSTASPITGGTITGIAVLANNTKGGIPVTSDLEMALPLITMTDLNLEVTDILAALAAEDSGDFAAIENLFLTQSWVYNGSNKDDFLFPEQTSSDGVPINMMGNDTVNLNDGNDIHFSGDGDDKVFGGNGLDTLHGGNGRDRLVGGKEQDLIYGEGQKDHIIAGKGNDYIKGGGGKDRIKGGVGDDEIDGGTGADILTGGKGADTFEFREGDGNDVITDYDVTEDMIKLIFEAPPEGLTASVDGGNTVVSFNGTTITLLGVTDLDALTASIDVDILSGLG